MKTKLGRRFSEKLNTLNIGTTLPKTVSKAQIKHQVQKR